MGPKRSTSSESQSSRPLMLRSRPTTASTCPISSPPTSCPPGPRKRERDSTATRPPTESRPQSCSTSPTWAMERTGLTTVPSPRSRTKDSADHAGHSPPPAPWRVPISSPQETSSPPPSNSSLTATASTTTAATVVSWTTPSSTPRPTHSRLKTATHTLPRERPAITRNLRVLSPPLTTMMLPTLRLNSRPPSTSSQSPSPSRPINPASSSTTEVSSPTDAEPDSTTVFSPSDGVPWMMRNTSSSRTPGDHHGETTDTSELHQTNAVSPMLPPTQPPTEESEYQM